MWLTTQLPLQPGEGHLYKHIVVGTDGSDGARAAVDVALKLAGLTGATLHVVKAYKVVDAVTTAMGADVPMMMTTGVSEANEAAGAHAEEICHDVVQRAKHSGVEAHAHAMAAKPADALIHTAADVGADLIVVGNRGMSGARRFVLGSVPDRVAHHCPTSVLIVDTSPTRA